MRRRQFISSLVSGALLSSASARAYAAADSPTSHTRVDLLTLISPEEHGRIGDGTSQFDATAVLQQAINKYDEVYIPEGKYNIETASIKLRSGTQILGSGRGRTILGGKYKFNTWGMLHADSGSAEPERNIKNIRIADITLIGHVEELGYHGFTHLISLHGVSDVIIERVELLGFRGDGLYLGSGVKAKEERHNFNITVRDCLFDGLIKSNRNGLSCIDCTTLLVQNSVFQNIGNSSLSSSVGAIDFEPDNSYNYYKNITIRNCSFKNIDSTNTAAITFFNSRQNAGNMRDWVIDSCTFENCFWGLAASTLAKTPRSEPDNLKITNSRFVDTKSIDLTLRGLSKVEIDRCVFETTSANKENAKGGIQVGFPRGTCRNAINWKISNCSFKLLRPQNGLMTIYGARGLTIANNTFSDIAAPIFYFPGDVAAGTGRYLEGINVTGNTFDSTGDVGRGLRRFPLIRADERINQGSSNTFINCTNKFSDNKSLPSAAPINSSISVVFNGQETKRVPVSGTWDIGSYVVISKPNGSTQRVACSAPGTFGTLDGVSAFLTSGSDVLTQLDDPHGLLREGHKVRIGERTEIYTIAQLDGDNVRLSGAFKDASGRHTLNWTPPIFGA